MVGTETSCEKRAVLDAKIIANFFAFLELDLSEEDVKSSVEWGREENRPEPLLSDSILRVHNEHDTEVLQVSNRIDSCQI